MNEVEDILNLNIKSIGPTRAEKIAMYYSNLMSGEVDWVCSQLKGFPKTVLEELKNHFAAQKQQKELLEDIVKSPKQENEPVKQPESPTKHSRNKDLGIKVYQNITFSKTTLEIVLIGIENAKRKIKNWKHFGVNIVGYIHAGVDLAVIADNMFYSQTRKKFRQMHNIDAIKESEFIKLLETR